MGKAVHTISPTEPEGTGPAGLLRGRSRPSYDERREKLERWIERAIERLDRFDAVNEDREPQSDDEPWLGWPTSEPDAATDEARAAYWHSRAHEDDVELDTCDDEDADPAEDGGDDEPSLGWPMGQWQRLAAGYDGGRDAEEAAHA